jgi:hypothetical protein
MMILVTPKVGAKHKLLFNKPASSWRFNVFVKSEEINLFILFCLQSFTFNGGFKIFLQCGAAQVQGPQRHPRVAIVKNFFFSTLTANPNKLEC